ncbi:FAD-dependent oxidoreductase [Clostridium chauvoei]|uniref:FAD-binding oxidoreductase n=2 Tax=Clostridium chauvoei TaxID=46867 RepID=A0ABD4RKA1_9CLOT|nr:FAD-binding oxidoreductase [Clostridium chauvoei]ATD54561.1 FAD-linked oxidase [Clostridium chauvoei]ATD57758.1 FAD-linked oxidase [Clostridium chauvoei]MBX7281539.1 FAD-binding oxidoreductase [Clostridium chauvoei]MBX7284059.1 FAD-binding oxidoreductase [Clostridium chauvoei]MBX7286587.1 FAD-binding oxidoreductase [Clostridium chauvoei]
MKDLNYYDLTGKVVTREDFSYEEDRKSWNRAIEKYPLVIIYCYTEEDVINSINWARNNSLPIRIRSGAHNYEGYSTGNDVVVIDVSNMNYIEIDEENNTVKIQGGVRNRELYEFLGKRLIPFPGGGCPTVGIIGLTLGGGWGYSARLLGLAADSLQEIKLINYKGEKIIANKEKNDDLFWASLGGGGGNFGIVTSMKFKLPKKIKMATLINIDYKHINIEENINIVEIFQDEFKSLDRRVNFKMAIYNSKEKGRGVKITGLFYGDKNEANEILKPFKNLSDNMDFDLEYMSVLEANRKIQDSHPPYESYKSTGRFVYKDYTRDEIKNLIDLVENREDGSIYTAVSFYGLGGAIADIDNKSTAFYYRDAKFIMGIQSVWEEAIYAPKNREWVKGKVEYIKTITKGTFINFPFVELNDYEKEYYGENLSKLKCIKSKYDPENVFNFPQSIKLK